MLDGILDRLDSAGEKLQVLEDRAIKTIPSKREENALLQLKNAPGTAGQRQEVEQTYNRVPEEGGRDRKVLQGSMQSIKPQIQEVQQTPSSRNVKESALTHITVQLLETRDKETKSYKQPEKGRDTTTEERGRFLIRNKASEKTV